MVGEGASECGGNVRVGQVAEGLGLVNQFEIENTDSRIQVDTKDLAKLIFGLIESVFRLHEGRWMRIRILESFTTAGTPAPLDANSAFGYTEGLNSSGKTRRQ